jgi:hypothetical protein
MTFFPPDPLPQQEYGAICPSAAYEACQPPFRIYWEEILELFYVGLEPQPTATAQRCHLQPCSEPEFRRLPKCWPIHIVEIAWWWLHMPIHSRWSLSRTFHMLGGDVGSIPCWVRASATAQWCFLQAQQWMISEDFPILGLHTLLTYGLMMDQYAYPQHMKVVNHLTYVERGCGNHSMLG